MLEALMITMFVVALILVSLIASLLAGMVFYTGGHDRDDALNVKDNKVG